MSDLETEFNLLDKLAESFLGRLRRGERPRLAEYVERHPELAERIREMLPALAALEHFGNVVAPADSGLDDGTTPHRCGEYRILRQIGRGGMGIVYEAVQESLGRHVALKVLNRSGSVLTERFQREARIASKLHHTNIVPVYGVGSDNDVPYYAMQFIAGQGLNLVIDEVRRQRTVATPHGGDETEAHGDSSSDLARTSIGDYYRRVAALALQAADALAYAHGQGVLHRDLKPANLLLDTQGTLWIADFGLAKADDSLELTETGEMLGTLRYLAPERLSGTCDARSDIFGLGATFYELLALTPAFPAAERAQVIEQVSKCAPPRPSTLARGLPRDLETIVQKSMAAAPGQRYASAADLADDLRQFLADRPIKARRQTVVEKTRRFMRRYPIGSALGGALAVVVPTALVVVTILYVQAKQARGDADENAIQAGINAAAATAQANRADQKSKFARQTVDDMVFALGENLQDTTDVPAIRLEMHQKALNLYEQFAAEPGGDAPEIQEMLARNYLLTGRSLRTTDRPGEQRSHYESALRIVRELVRSDAYLATCSLLYLDVLHTLGEFDFASGKLQEAAAVLREGIQHADQRAEERPDDAVLHPHVVRFRVTLAGVQRRLGQRIECRDLLKEARDRGEKALQHFPGHSPIMLNTALARHQYGVTLEGEFHNPSDAIPEFRAAIKLFEVLLNVEPDRPSRAQFLAKCCNDLAVCLGTLSKTKEALDMYRRAEATFDRLHEQFPKVPAYRHARAMTWGNLAMSRGFGTLPEREAQFNRAIDELTKLTLEDPNNVEYRDTLAIDLGNLAVLFVIQQRNKDAVPLFDKAKQTLFNVYPKGPQEDRKRRNYVGHLKGKAYALLGLRQHAEAIDSLREAAEFAPTPAEWDEVTSIRLSMSMNVAKPQEVLAELEDWRKKGRFAGRGAMLAAGVYGTASGLAAGDATLKESWQQKALDLGRQAITAGYADVVALRTQNDFNALRQHPEFQGFIRQAEVNAKKKQVD